MSSMQSGGGERGGARPNYIGGTKTGGSTGMHGPRSTSYAGRLPASARASAAAKSTSKKADTKCELRLRRALWAAGCRYKKNYPGLPGTPDVVFIRARLIIFCDGDFWHGNKWSTRREKLQSGSNPDYWIAKIEKNMARDLRVKRLLEEMGWTVLRFWESEVNADCAAIVEQVSERLAKNLNEKELPLTKTVLALERQ